MPQAVVSVLPETQLNTFQVGDQLLPMAGALQSGGFFSIWQSFSPSGASKDIYGQRFTKTGSPDGAQLAIHAPTPGIDEWNLTVDELNGGDIVAAWRDNNGDTAPHPRSKVLFQIFDGNGQATSDLVEIDPNGSVRSISFHPDGTSFVLTLDLSSAIVGHFFDINGGAIKSPIEITGSSLYTFDAIGSQILSRDNLAAVYWAEKRNAGFGRETYDWMLQFVDSQSDGAQQVIRIETGFDGLRGYYGSTTVTELQDGSIVFSWERKKQAATDSLQTETALRRFDADGVQIGDDIVIPGNASSILKTVALDSGRFAVVYETNKKYALAYDSNGTPLGEPVQIQTERDSTIQGVEPLTGGRFAVFYTSEDEDGAGVFVQVFSVNSPATGAPNISGQTIEGETLSVDISDIADANGFDPSSIHLQWLRDGQVIENGTSAKYKLVPADSGTRISVKATFRDDNGAWEELESVSSGIISNINNLPTGQVVISGDARLHGKLKAETSTIRDDDGTSTFYYQWTRSNTPIAGATNAIYQIVGDDVQEDLSVKVFYKDGFGQIEELSSSTISPKPLDPGVSLIILDSETGEDGDMASFSVGLNAAIHSDVSIKFQVSDGSEAKLLTTSVTFTGDNWDKMQTIELVGLDDYENDGDASFAVTGVLNTDDSNYALALVETLSFRNLDDGEDQNQQKYGTNGPDNLEGMNGSDRLYGLGNLDVLRGGNGDDRLYGGYDDDRLFGDEGNDWLYGEADDDMLEGGDGHDELFGGEGADVLRGGNGNDILDGGTGIDTMSGGAGNDTYYVDRAEDVVWDGGHFSDHDTVIVIGNFTYELGSGLENASLADDSGSADLTGNRLNNELTGNNDNNVIKGGAGSDTLYSRGGDDTVIGGRGHDLIIGGSGEGNDTYLGGRGADTVKYTSAESGIRVNLKNGTATSIGKSDQAGIGDDVLSRIENVISGKYGDIVVGNGAANQIIGRRGSDLLYGASGADDLLGGKGQDMLFGGAGADFIRGDKGNDVLIGGAGADTFYFRKGDGRDTLNDFEVGIDHIEIGRGAARMRQLDFEQQGDDVLVSFRNVEFSVLDLRVKQLQDADNFLF